ncbi:hypothetical protein G6R29_02475 [Fructobacillus sp. M2-14]|uniref:Uncharacterized protein n=1 Tax=Fructobacillus broussonetiae TaxID=2713173 RepID=A0ABS5R2W2_9LACO|nr:hypothetical protein [Fructobacillus broussonetiae]MBS9338502.1 hypothetical protein [Fructobacillus broussonetiae]
MKKGWIIPFLVAFFCCLPLSMESASADPVLPDTYNPVTNDTSGGTVVEQDELAQKKAEAKDKAKKQRTLIESIGFGALCGATYLSYAFIKENKKKRK